MASINAACNAIAPAQTGAEMAKVLAAVLADLATIKADLTAIAAQFNKLRTDYNANTSIGTDTTATAITLTTGTLHTTA